MKRSIRIFLPFLLLLFGFLIFSLDQQVENQKSLKTDLGVLPSPKSVIIGEDVNVKLEPSPTATLIVSTPIVSDQKNQNIETMPTSQYQTDDLIIFGPPTNSIFPLNSSVAIYWNWPFELKESLFFSVYLTGDSGDKLIGSVDEPTLGKKGYQLYFSPVDVVESPGTFFFEIRLENKESGINLLVSDRRMLIFKE